MGIVGCTIFKSGKVDTIKALLASHPIRMLFPQEQTLSEQTEPHGIPVSDATSRKIIVTPFIAGACLVQNAQID